MRVRDARLRYTGAWLLPAIGLLFSTVAYAGAGVWTSGKPYGGEIRALAINPASPGTVYAGTYEGGVFKSTDSGGTWAAASTGLTNPDIRAVVINPVVDEMSARDMFQKLSTVTGRFLTAKLRHLGYVPRDENVHRAVMAQRPVVDLFPMAPASRAIVEVAARLFSEPAPQILEGGMKMMWQRLMREAEVPR